MQNKHPTVGCIIFLAQSYSNLKDCFQVKKKMELYLDHQYKKAGRIVDITEKYIYIQISHSIQDD